jgi:HlyD family type I secretion membrane fusion protein
MSAPLATTGLILVSIAIVLLTFGVLATWSLLAPLSSAVIAAGAIVVDGSRKAVQHPDGGVISAIHVRDGDRVEAGQILVELDDSKLASMLATLQPLLEMTLAQRARLLAERRGRDEIDFPSELLQSTTSTAAMIVADQRRMFLARRAALESRRAALLNRRLQSQATATGLEKQIASQQERLRLTRVELEGTAKLAGKGYAPERRVLELNRAMAELESELAALEARHAEVSREAEFSTVEITRIENSFLENVETELQTVEKERYDLLERTRTIKDQIKRLKIRAPVAGTVVKSAVHTVSGVLMPGVTLLELVPAEEPLVIDAQVRPVDVDGLRVGLAAEIRFPSDTDRLLPKLHGRVLTISADRLVDPLQGTAYFAAQLTVDPDSIRLFGRDRLRPGLPVEVLLLKGERTLFDYLFSPVRDIFARAMLE